MAGPITNRIHVVGTNLVTRVGFLSDFVMQHPVLSGPSIEDEDSSRQFYFDLGEKPNSMNQIIVVHPTKMSVPTDKKMKIELKGTSDQISFSGGKVGESTYRNEVFQLHSWKYLEDKTSQQSSAP
jgi:hypothetical protein